MVDPCLLDIKQLNIYIAINMLYTIKYLYFTMELFKGLFPADALDPKAAKTVVCEVSCLCSSKYFS